MKFIRWGGLSPVVQKGYNPEMPTFHCPPARKGLYAFPFPFIEPFLLSGDFDNNHKEEKGRKFEYDGMIWHHLTSALGTSQRTRGSWLLTTMKVYEIALRKELHNMRSTSYHRVGFVEHGDTQKNFQVSTTRGTSRDHLEVFIERP